MDILKKYSATISVFDMMAFSSQVIEENKYVQDSYRKDSQIILYRIFFSFV